MKNGNNDFYEPIWYGIKLLKNILLFPLEISDLLLIDLKSGLGYPTNIQKLDSDNLRKF